MTSRAAGRPSFTIPETLPACRELLVALDIDGTIVDYDGNLHPVVKKGITVLRRSGADVILATGRGISGVMPIARQLDIHEGYAVCSNGAVVTELDDSEEGYTLTDVVTFDPRDVLEELVEIVPGALFLVDDADGRHLTTGKFPAGELPDDIPVVSFEEVCHIAASRVTVRAPDLSAEELRTIIQDSGMHGVSYSVGWTAWMDISPQGVSKASALEMLRGRLERERNATVAVGDGTNDLDMLEWAHWSVAMGQAMDIVKQSADALTVSIDEGGLAFVLSALLTR
ncbi:MAG: HAD family hydrolase [Bowdeniella nasicola]|nr:HAD family hydrolase [Bowdeniella nasicola]